MRRQMAKRNKIYKLSNALAFIILTLVITSVTTLGPTDIKAASVSTTKVATVQDIKGLRNGAHKEYAKEVKAANSEYWQTRAKLQKTLNNSLKTAKTRAEIDAARQAFKNSLKTAKANMHIAKETAKNNLKNVK